MNGRLPAQIAVAVVLSHCSKPTSPPGPLPGAAEYQALGAWLAGQGIPAPAGGPPAGEAAGKAASGHRLLGDATGDGAVTFWDLWPLWQYLTGKTYMAEHYDFDLLDIDRDGDNDWDDLKHLGRFLYAAESGNPWNIGEPLAPPVRAALSPSPSELDLVADGTLWQRLDLSVTTTDGAASADTVRVRVNPADAGPPVLEIARRTRAPGNDWCAGEPDDTIKGVHGKVFWLAGCQAGAGAVEILDGDDNLLASYPVTVREPPSDDPADSFDIELVFDTWGGAEVFTKNQKALIRLAADRWEEVIVGDLPDVDLGGGDVVDDLRISVGRTEGGGFGGVAWVTDERPNGTPYLAWMNFDGGGLVHRNSSLALLALHEIGHCLGIGIGSTWEGLQSGDGYSFTGPLAIQAFNEAGGGSFVGDKVPTEQPVPFTGGHWRRGVFTLRSDPNRYEETKDQRRAELMASDFIYGVDIVDELPPGPPSTLLWPAFGPPRGQGFAYLVPSVYPDWVPDAWGRPITRLSAITVGALADMGYEVDFSQAEPYTLPVSAALPAGKVVAAGSPPLVCGVGHGIDR